MEARISISTVRSIKGFDLLELIGEGAYGVVYRAYQVTVDREVAVKIILPEYANQPDFIRRFDTEAQLVAQLEHLHIVPLYDYWRDPEGAYLVMRLMKGGSLEEALREDDLWEPDAAARLVDQISSALDAAHQQGVVHRDLKPANILLDEDSNAYLSDFGIAKELAAAADITQTGAILGTPAYISPEQVQSQPVSPQTDLYALGVMVYEIFAGRHPFPNTSTAELVVKHLQEPLPYVRESRADLPAALDGVIQRATAKDPADRYPSASALADDFRRALRLDAAVSAVPESELYNPYKGLRAFQEADSEDFFGRETLIGQLLAQMAAPLAEGRFLAVVGPSGSGKSSVVKAGLVPALRKGALPGSDKWFIIEMHPGTQPMAELELALLSITADPYLNFGDLLKTGTRGLTECVKSALPDGDDQLLLVIDQFEELFSLVGDEAERRRFLESLFSAVIDPESRLRVLITLRADFYDRPLMHPDFGRLIEERTVVVLPLSPEELEAVIRKPAERVGVILEQGLVAAITSDVADQPGALPLLQYALTELFEHREGRMLTCEAYQSIGGVLGALGRRAEEVYASLGGEGKVVARQLFLRLVTLGEGAEDTRRRVLQAELEALTSHSPLPLVGEGMGVREVLDSFGKVRLLTFDHDPETREPTIEVAHEALLQEWRRLRSWLDDSRADIRLQRVLANAALEWQRMDHDPGYLLRDSRLDQFEAWAATTDIALTQLEGDYLEASLAERRARQMEEQQRLAREAAMERRSRNFLRGLVGVLALATVVAVALSVYALSARNRAQAEADARATQQVIAQSEMSQRATAEAREIEQREEALNQASARATAEHKNLLRQEQDQRQISVDLAIQAMDKLKGPNPELATLLALEILEVYPYTPQAELALYKAVEDAGAHMIPRVGSLALTSTYWAPSGKTIATSLDDQYILIQDIETGEEDSRIATEPGCNSVQEWSPSGDRLPAFGEGCAPVIYDVESGRPITTLESQSDQSFTSTSWSPDGNSIVTGGEDPVAQIWDATTGGKLLDLVGHDHFIEEVAWSPTGNQIATASYDSLIKIWDAATGVEERSLSGHFTIVNAVSWSPDGERIVSGGADNAVYVWDTHMGRILFRLRGHKDGVIDVAWSPDGRFIASLSWDHSVRVWDAESGTELFRFNTYTFRDPNSISWSPSGDQLLIGGQYHHRIWDLNELSPLMSGHTGTLLDAQWSPEGRLAATASEDNTLRIWDSKSGEHIQTLNLQEVPESFAWSPDSEKIVAATKDGTTQIWDMSSGEISNEITSHSGLLLYSPSWSPDGSRIAALRSPDGIIVIWDAGKGDEIDFNQGNTDCPLDHLSWSPGSDRLLTYCQGESSLQIWDAASGEILNRIEALTGNLDVLVWSPDGDYIAAGYEDGTIEVWNPDDGNASPAYSLPSTGYGILDLSWSPNSIRLASAEEGGMVRIWDLSSSGEVANFPVAGSANSVDWSPDGLQVIATSSEGNIPIIHHVWESTADLVDYARQCCAPRALTPEERTSFDLPD